MKYLKFFVAGILLFLLSPKSYSDEQTIPKAFLPIFEVGKLNGIPSKPNQALVKDEFKIASYEEKTIQIKKNEQFPQKLFPTQRVAIFLPEMPRIDHLLQISVISDGTEDHSAPDSMKVTFNDKDLWRHVLTVKKSYITIIIPAQYIKKYSNILQIRNAGNSNIAFDWLSLTEFFDHPSLHLVIEDLYKMQYPYRDNFNMGMSSINSGIEISKAHSINTENSGFTPHIPNKSFSSIDSRRKELKLLTESFKKNPQVFKGNSLVASSVKKVQLYLLMGIEPVLEFKGSTNLTELEQLSSLFKNLVFFWAINRESKDQTKKMVKIIKKNIPSSTIITSMPVSNSSLLCDLRQWFFFKEPLPFFISDKLSLSYFQPLNKWGKWSYQNNSHSRISEMQKDLKRVSGRITEWFWSGGSSVILTDVVEGQRFFDYYTGKPSLPYFALKRISKLFEGSPCKYYCNVIPVVRDDFLFDTYWTAAKNGKGVFTVQIASWRDSGKKVKLICPIPFSGEIEYEIETGFIPEDQKENKLYPNSPPIKIKRGHINVPSNQPNLKVASATVELELNLSALTTIRLIKKGAKLPARANDSIKSNYPPVLKKRNIPFNISYSRPNPKEVRTAVRQANGIIKVLGSNYKGSHIEATRGTIDDVKNVTPWEKQSNLIEISYLSRKVDATEGACLYFGAGPKEAREFSFWVYPKSKLKLKTVTLKFYFTSEGKNRIFSSRVKTNLWQRIIISCDKIKPPYWSNICFVGDLKLPEYKKDNIISFEFNGFSVLGQSDRELGETGLKYTRVFQSDDKYTIIILGTPGKYVDFRHTFSNPLAFKRVSALAKVKKLNLFWKEGARTLQITGMFPVVKDFILSEKLKENLTESEMKIIKKKHLVPIGIELKYEN